MTIKIQKLSLLFYVFFFSSLYSLSKLGAYAKEGQLVLVTQLIIFFILLGIGLYFLKQRKQSITDLNDGTDFTLLYRHEWITAGIVCISSVIDSFFQINISYYAYLIAVFYHLYWFLKNYSIYSQKDA